MDRRITNNYNYILINHKIGAGIPRDGDGDGEEEVVTFRLGHVLPLSQNILTRELAVVWHSSQTRTQ